MNTTPDLRPTDNLLEKEATKQVIVIRKDLNMRRGKEIAQGSHASMAFLTRGIVTSQSSAGGTSNASLNFTEEEQEWLRHSFTKVCLRVNSEDELYEIQGRARAAGLTVHLVVDSGKTEFNGVPTPTCLAIGPHYASKIDAVTGHLTLY